MDQGEVQQERAQVDEARPSLRARVIRLGFVVALICLDLWSKASVFAWLEENEYSLEIDVHGHARHLIFGEWFAFMESRNRGAVGGSLASVPHLLVGGRIAAALFLIWLLWRAPKARRVFTLSLILILAGATGNLWDNLFLPPPEDHPFGEVRDFIDVFFAGIGDSGWHFPTFNLADSCICVGAALLLISGFGNENEDAAPAPVRPGTEPQ